MALKAGIKISDIQILIKLRFGKANLINMHLGITIQSHKTQIFNHQQTLIEFTKINLILKYTFFR